MNFTLYRSDFVGVESNCRYPRQQNIRCAEDLKAAAAFDHVCVAFKDFIGNGRISSLPTSWSWIVTIPIRRILLTGFPWKSS